MLFTVSRVRVASLALGIATFVLAARASASPTLPRLVVDRATDAADCPDGAALASAVERHMQHPAFDQENQDPSALVFKVKIVRSAEGFSATLEAGESVRTLSDPGSTCAELADALALTLAILLDSDPVAHPEPPPNPSEAALPGPVATPIAAPKPPREPIRQRAPARPWNLGVEVGAAETVGFLTPFSFAAFAETTIRVRSASFGLGALGIPSRVLNDAPPGQVHLWLVAGTMRGCLGVLGKPERARVSVCAQPMVGAVHGEGHGYTVDRNETRPWVAMGAGGLAEGALVGRLGWSVRLMVTIPVLSHRFVVDQDKVPTTFGDASTGKVPTTLVFDPLPIGVLLGAGLHWAIF